MFDAEVNDTIVAIATPPGEGAIGIVRVSGSNALSLVSNYFAPLKPQQKILPFRPILGSFFSSDERRATSDKIDQILLFYFPAPRSYTGEEVVEIHAHGNPVILKQLVHTLLSQQGRLAEPGEFTKRAFLNGKLDLAQAEAVSALIASKTELAAKASLAQLEGSLSRQVESLRKKILDMFVYVEAAIDYPEEDLELLSMGELQTKAEHLVGQIKEICKGAQYGKILKEGISIAIVGKPNVGKSSLLNALLNEDRAIVTPIAGTTRDIVSESANINGIPVKFVDTAGIRESDEVVEKEGIKRSVKALEQADVILFVCDGSCDWEKEDTFIYQKVFSRNHLLVVNKTDLPLKMDLKRFVSPLLISAGEGRGLDELRQVVLSRIKGAQGLFSHEKYLLNLRHEESLLRAEKALAKSLDSLTRGLSGEFVAVDLREALDCLGEIVGKTTTDDILDKIFSTFCIGK